MILIGYSGHGYVACSIAEANDKHFTGYCDYQKKEYNPFHLTYHGFEDSPEGIGSLRSNPFFIAIGYNEIREGVYNKLLSQFDLNPVNLVHPSVVIGSSVVIAPHGVLMAPRVVINPLSVIGTGAICNTGAIIEHECNVGNFAHIGPGAILCGNVTIGEKTFVGAGSVIRQGIKVGKNVTIGAGAVVVKNVEDGTTVMGNPAVWRG